MYRTLSRRKRTTFQHKSATLKVPTSRARRFVAPCNFTSCAHLFILHSMRRICVFPSDADLAMFSTMILAYGCVKVRKPLWNVWRKHAGIWYVCLILICSIGLFVPFPTKRLVMLNPSFRNNRQALSVN